jgi:hypothetical protein
MAPVVFQLGHCHKGLPDFHEGAEDAAETVEQPRGLCGNGLTSWRRLKQIVIPLHQPAEK